MRCHRSETSSDESAEPPRWGLYPLRRLPSEPGPFALASSNFPSSDGDDVPVIMPVSPSAVPRPTDEKCDATSWACNRFASESALNFSCKETMPFAVPMVNEGSPPCSSLRAESPMCAPFLAGAPARGTASPLAGIAECGMILAAEP
eukprot:scaffold47368_cov36-Tisochrysis_lutea.AAC.1